MKKIAIFSSGNGSNAENIIKYFKQNNKIKVELILSNRPGANVLTRAKNHNVDTFVFTKSSLNKGSALKELNIKKIDFIVLAGFLLKIPEGIIGYYKDKIVNIHPSLLPLYGGKGMYGIHVHKKVFEAKETKSGITIHFATKKYDDGAVIFQAQCPIDSCRDPKDIQKKVHKLEMKFFPRIIETLIDGKN